METTQVTKKNKKAQGPQGQQPVRDPKVLYVRAQAQPRDVIAQVTALFVRNPYVELHATGGAIKTACDAASMMRDLCTNELTLSAIPVPRKDDKGAEIPNQTVNITKLVIKCTPVRQDAK